MIYVYGFRRDYFFGMIIEERDLDNEARKKHNLGYRVFWRKL